MKRFATIAALFSLAGWLALAGPAAAFPGNATSHVDSARVSFKAIDTRGHARGGDRFSPDDLGTLVIAVSWQTLVGVHMQRVELVTPDGSLYQSFTTEVASYDGRALIETPVRVGGTWITEYQMFGDWTVNVYLDNDTTLVATGRFTLAH